MKQKDIVALLSEYESSHPVEQYTAYGWHVWPVLRNLLGYRLAALSEEDFDESASPSFLGGKQRILGTASRLTTDTLRRCFERAGAPFGLGTRIPRPNLKAQDIVILTSSTRVLPKGPALYHRLVDPIVEKIVEHGNRILVWERGEIRLPRHHVPASISQPLRVRYLVDKLRRRFPARLPKPPWFVEYTEWFSSRLKQKGTWRDLEDVRYVQAASQIFESWLASTGCRLLMVDIWYDRESMAAILAARRLGIPSVELQHGLHGFAYKAWTKVPAGGYEVFPDRFWVWGKDIAQALLEANSDVLAPDQVIIGGNLWINKWREPGDPDIQSLVSQAREFTAPYEKAILVTLQKGIQVEEILFPAIAASPRSWLWLIRLHQQCQHQLGSLRAKCRSIGHHGVNLDESTTFPLYALFQAVHHHLTWYSTCALEALAFGIPSVIVHPTGRIAYQEYLDAGVMHYAADPAGILEGLRLCSRVRPENCRSLANSVFAPPKESDRSLELLLGG